MIQLISTMVNINIQRNIVSKVDRNPKIYQIKTF